MRPSRLSQLNERVNEWQDALYTVTPTYTNLVHLTDQLVDQFLAVTGVTTLGEVVGLLLPATERVGELEGPQEVVGDLEVRTDSDDLVDQIFDADDVVLTQRVLDDGVLGDRDALTVDLSVSTLVDKIGDSLEVRLTVGDVRIDNLKQLRGSLIQTDEDSVVDLTKTQQLKDLLDLRGNAVDTLDTDGEDKLRSIGNVQVTGVLGLTSHTDLGSLLLSVFLDVLLGSLEDDLAGSLLGLLLLGGLFIMKERWREMQGKAQYKNSERERKIVDM